MINTSGASRSRRGGPFGAVRARHSACWPSLGTARALRAPSRAADPARAAGGRRSCSLSAAVVVNAYFGYVPHARRGARDEPSLARDVAGAGPRSGGQRSRPRPVVPLTVPRTVVGLLGAPGPGVPPACLVGDAGGPPLPVVMLLHGEPGDPSRTGPTAARRPGHRRRLGGHARRGRPRAGHARHQRQPHRRHGVRRQPARQRRDLPDGRRPGRRPAAVRHDAAGPVLGVAGLSEGGACAIMLALRHPDLFATFGDFGGLSGPRVGESDTDTDVHGRRTLRRVTAGVRRARARRPPGDRQPGLPQPRRVVRGRRRRRRPAGRGTAAGPARRRGGHLHLPDRRPGRRAHLRRLERGVPRVAAVDGGSGSGWCRPPRR